MKDRQLEAFRAVMLQGSITKAGEMLHLSQPAVSRYIAALEDEVGFRLFSRQKEGSIPTPEAYSFFEELQHSYTGLSRLGQVAKEIRELRRGHIKMATLPAASFDLIPSIANSFLDTHDELKITLDVHTSTRIVDLVAARQFDIGFAQLANARAGIEVLRTYRSECVCVLPRKSDLARHDIIEPRHLESARTIALAHHTLSARHVDAAFLAQNIRQDILLECQPSYVACCLAMQGAGAAIADPITASFFRSKAIIIKPFKPVVPFDIQLIRPDTDTPSLPVQSFLDFAIEKLDSHELLNPVA